MNCLRNTCLSRFIAEALETVTLLPTAILRHDRLAHRRFHFCVSGGSLAVAVESIVRQAVLLPEFLWHWEVSTRPLDQWDRSMPEVLNSHAKTDSDLFKTDLIRDQVKRGSQVF